MEKYTWLNTHSRTFLERGYLSEGQTPEQRIREIAENAERILNSMSKSGNDFDGFADKFEHYMALGYYSNSTPVWTNFGNERGLPVSCFGSYIGDETTEIFRKASEVGLMSKYGGGTSGYFGDLRPRGSKIKKGGGESGGPTSFLDLVDSHASIGIREFINEGGSLANIYELFDITADTISQGAARRGSFAAYLPIEHPDIEEFLQIRSTGHPIQNMSIGVTVTDKWLEERKTDESKKVLWRKIIKKKFETGYPYIVFIDTVNDNAPQVYKDKGKKILASNLCSEIALASDNANSFVCVLSSLNLLHWDEIVKTDAIETMIYFLDAVNEEFVRKTEGINEIKDAHHFAKTQRALGMGALGWHSLLQSKMIAFESMEAKLLNASIWKIIRERADKATEQLAVYCGEPELLVGYGRRNVTTLAIAPTTSSSFILGQVSPSIEPENSNFYVKKLAKGNFSIKNRFLVKLLAEKGQDTKDVWKSILLKEGSVQHLDFLTPHEKDVFKTFSELSQKEIIIQAAQRQPRIDQSQSLNLCIPTNTPAKKVSELILFAHENKVKSLYYQRGTSPTQNLARIIECKSCEG